MYYTLITQWLCRIFRIFASVHIFEHPPIRMRASLHEMKFFRDAFNKLPFQRRFEKFALSCKNEAMCRQLVIVEVNPHVCMIGAVE